MLMTGVRRWKRKYQQHPAFAGCCFLLGAVNKKAVPVRGYVFLREMADAGNFGGSVPECKRSTVLSFAAVRHRRFHFPVNSGGYSCLQDYVSHWRWTACHLMRWSSFHFI
ncbi:hypothetical protein F0328_09905 [Citrobacter portucalensis]|nr:hypothetical protein F0328_09905 [Citrobacter portucalensis]